MPGATDNTLSQLTKRTVVFGEEYVELKTRVEGIQTGTLTIGTALKAWKLAFRIAACHVKGL